MSTPVTAGSELTARPWLERVWLGVDGGRGIARGAIITAAYVVAARLGFEVAFVAEQVTTVWAPTGIAIAALMLWGLRLWPAVWLGAFLANVGTAAPLWTAGVIATGNALEAVAAAWGIRRLSGGDTAFGRVNDVIAFVIVAAGVATAVSATIGVTALCAAAVQPWTRFPALWFAWWLGDALGALVVAPAMVTTVRRAQRSRQYRIRTAAFALGAVAVTHLVFGQLAGFGSHPVEFAVFPLVVAAAVRGGPQATSIAVLGVSSVAIAHTVRGGGPFAAAEVHHSLILLQAFMGVLATTGLLLAAAIAEREASEHRERDAAAAVRHREQMLRLAQRAGGVATFEWDFRRHTAHCSSEFFQIFGLPAQDGVMTGAEWGRFVHPEDRDRMASHLSGVLAGRETPSADYRILAADGSLRWLTYAGQLQATPHGERLLGIVADITDRKRAEVALQEAKAAAESANHLKDHFLATLSHELRTPLNAILGYARMLQMNTIAPEKQPQAVDVIVRNAVAQCQLVDDLLDISRITTGRVRLDPAPIGVAAVVGEALEAVRPAAAAKGVALDVALDPDAGLVRGDPTRLQQVFWNLLTNAVKFTAAGGRVSVLLRRQDAAIDVIIADTGVGISPEFLPYVFDPFRQADARPGRGQPGLGLGLAISRQLVELHGGIIHASSAGLDQGATFTVRLPRFERPDPSGADAPNQPDPDARM